MEHYTRQPAEMPIPGLTEAETLEYYRLQTEGMFYGYHSLTPENLGRLTELEDKVQQSASRRTREPVQ